MACDSHSFHVVAAFVLMFDVLPAAPGLVRDASLRSAAPIADDVLEAVTEILAVSEQLLEYAEAARYRKSVSIKDLCVRKYQVNQAKVSMTVRHVFDKMRCAGAIDRCAPEILGSEIFSAAAMGLQGPLPRHFTYKDPGSTWAPAWPAPPAMTPSCFVTARRESFLPMITVYSPVVKPARLPRARDR